MTASPGREHAAPSRILVLGGTSELALAILAALDAPPGAEVVLAGRDQAAAGRGRPDAALPDPHGQV